jgi:RNA polymerase sigma-70 factor, ECF subfamily
MRSPQGCIRLFPSRNRRDCRLNGWRSEIGPQQRTIEAHPPPPTILRQTRPNSQLAELLRLYVERFNRRDWNAVRELIHADARLRDTDIFAGRMEDKYFTKFSAFLYPWQLATGELDQEQVVFMLGGWIPDARPSAVVRFGLRDSQIETIRHYNCPWLFTAAETMRVGETA